MLYQDEDVLATLGGGCFWCLEAVFENVRGIKEVISGYSGGKVINPTYEDICSGATGHAEVVHLIFNPSLISFREILEIFFTIHDPTQLNRQGNDFGPQYRSVIFYHSKIQKEVSYNFISELEKNSIWNDPIVTEVTAYTNFFPAEEYHQKYFQKNPYQPYCQLIILPKVIKFRKNFSNLWFSSEK